MSEALTQTLHSPSDIISAKEKTTGLMELNRQARFSFNKHLTNTRIKHTISRENEIKGKTVTKICSIHLNLFH